MENGRRYGRLSGERWALGAYLALGLGLACVPLFNVLHAESTAVLALAAFFVAGLSALKAFGRRAPFAQVWARQSLLLLAPLAVLTLSMAWAPNCAYATGLLLFLLFPVVTVVLAVSAAFFLCAARSRRRIAWLVGGGVAVVLLGPLYDLGLHPQFYTYNHIFGGVLGPIYDEELALRPGLFVFRAMTLLWAGVLYFGARWIVSRRSGERVPRKVALAWVGCVLLLGAGHLGAGPLGINTPEAYLREALGGTFRTAHFDLYFDPASVSAEEVRRMAGEHEYRYAQLAGRLGVGVEGRIQSYVYPSPVVKAALTGARYTSVAPVWLARPQMHLLRDQVDASLSHELAHVFTRAFGLPLLKASWSVGLVEGTAVALEPPDGLPTPHEQVSAALRASGRSPDDLAGDMAAQLSPFGFWTARGAVSYTTTGSFVGYLLHTYGAERLREVYARADFERVYGRPLGELASAWAEGLLRLPVVDRRSASLVRSRFSVPSLFERRCPHHVPPYRRHYRKAGEALQRGDTTRALSELDASLAAAPSFLPARYAWSTLRLGLGEEAVVLGALSALADSLRSPAIELVYGDAWTLSGDSVAGRAAYQRARERLAPGDEEGAAIMVLRRSVAGRPEVLRWILAGTGETPAGLPPAALLLAGRRYQGAGRPELALPLLRSTSIPEVGTPPASSPLLRRRRLVWLAESAYQAGVYETAQSTALEAAGAYLAVGGRNEAAALQDLAALSRHQHSNDPLSTETPPPLLSEPPP